ncbi:MAG: peptidylprolyl isomerase [Candidatus Eremiobacteraeota bacterium]|nr:peptidylprolyl isomerase [Candidatus Eremiobacteraeota bacterium]MBV8356216.1 peptidylprolyl isomerase [Candidatus Eremiobacteraeota bacterium]
MNVRRVAALVAAALFSLGLAACSSGSGTIATVNGQKIAKADFDKKLESSQAGKGTLNQLIQADLIDQYAKDHNLQVSDAEVNAKVDAIKARYPNGQFDQIVKQQGLTEADVRNIFRQQVILEKAVAPKVHVTDADIKTYFDKNRAVYDKPEQVRARHILVPDLKTAETVEAKLKSGAKFEDLARQFSTDPASKEKGGELGWFGHNQMVKPFDQAAFSLPIGKISQPVKSPFGYHIIQVEEKKPAVKATLANSADVVRQQLVQQQQQQQIPLFLQQLRSQTKIEVMDPRFADLANVPAPSPAAAAASAPAAPEKQTTVQPATPPSTAPTAK